MKFKAFTSALLVASMSLGVCAGAAEIGESLKVGDYAESAAENQRLIDNRPDIQRQMENIDRGVVAIKTENGVYISWRWLGTESADTLYNIYRDGEKLNDNPLNATNYIDFEGALNTKYSVSAVTDGVEAEKSDAVAVLANSYIDVPIEAPQISKIRVGDDNVTEVEMNTPFSAGDVSVADLDGDGEYEIILKWEPAYIRDSSKTGYTGDCYIDAYKLDGTRMWRVNMGPNIRAGAHDTQFIVYDFDGDGKAEMACRTADGTIAGDGTVIGDPDADWAALNSGKNLQGPLYLTVFKGEDGSVIDTVDYDPQTVGEGYDCTDWGDGYGNRSERYLAGLGSFDGVHTSFVMGRGYYSGPEGPLGGRTVVAAFGLADGKIVQNWRFDTKVHNNWYIAQGNHSMSVADIDYDGLDEVIYGALVLDHDGTVMYSTGLGHGDAQHVADILPSRPGLEIFSCQEHTNAEYGFDLRDARTGEILTGRRTDSDNGRATSADITPKYEGEECWSVDGELITADGTVILDSFSMPINFAIYWDGDLGRELQDEIEISKWNDSTETIDVIFQADDCHSINAGKATPALTADILGDWREETIYPTNDGKALRIFITTEPTSYRIPTLMHDPQYRNHVALQNVGYNQPTHTSYYLGYGTKSVPVPQMYTVSNGEEIRNPDLEKGSWSLDKLYDGTVSELALDVDTALINNKAYKLGVAPYLNEADRTMVPLRFIAEAFGADVSYDESDRSIAIKTGDTEIAMMPDEQEYTINDTAAQMDTAPIIMGDGVTMVPVRFVAEALGNSVDYDDGLIVISDKAAVARDGKARSALLGALKPDEEKTFDLWGRRTDTPNISASADETNAANVGDGDLDTVWHAGYEDWIIVDMGHWGSITGAGISFGDDKPHKIKLEVSSNGENWTVLNDGITFKGETGQKLRYIIGICKYNNMLRLTCLDEEGFDLSEFAVLEVR